MWTVQWNDNEPHSVHSVEELNAMLDKVHAEHAGSGRLVQIENENGETLIVGVGVPRSVVTYLPPDGWPSKSSRSERPFDDQETIVFFIGSHYSEMPMNSTVPVELAREAAVLFCERGELSPSIEWVDD